MNKEQIWIEKGYKTFAYDGPTGLKVERLAKSVGKSKSSFYHHFADLDVFTTHLLEYHLKQAKIMAQREKKSANEQELIEVIIDHKLDLLFNRQLRVHRENKDFNDCFCKVGEFSLPMLLPVWKKIMRLEENSYLADMVLRLSIENFFLQITDATINAAWLSGFFGNIRTMVSQFKQTEHKSVLDGSV